MLFDDHMQDRYCRFHYNPQTQEYERRWIQYADGTFEPMRRAGSISDKYEAERTHFNWWVVNKPAQWRPWDEGYGFSWNHDLGETAKPDGWGGKSDSERVFDGSPYFVELTPDADGRIEYRTERIDGRRETWEYRYDGEGRLTCCVSDTTWSEDFEYDDRGRRRADYAVGREPFMRIFEYTDDDRLLAVNDIRYEHCPAGFRSARTDGQAVTRYAYAGDYRLLGATLPDGREIAYDHDEDSQRSMKYVDGQPVEAYDWLDFIRLGRFFDGENEYAFHYGENERLPGHVTINDRMYTLGYDQVGSLKAVVSDTGDVVKAIQYGPFGNILWDTNPGLRMPIGFAGGLYDPDTGFVRFGWRDYDPDTGRWTAKDPIGDAGGDDDWYGYCLDDPVNGFDPFGLYMTSDVPGNDDRRSTRNTLGSASNRGDLSGYGGNENERGGNESQAAAKDDDKPGYINDRDLNAQEKAETPDDRAKDVVDNAKARRAAASVNEDPEQPLGGAVKTGKSNVPGSYGDFAKNAANLSAEEKKSGIGVDSVAAGNSKKDAAETNGVGIGVNAANGNYGVGLNGMVSEDMHGDRIVELNLNAGLDTSIGANVEATRQTTNAKDVGELNGWSVEHGVTVNRGKYGLGYEKVTSGKYSGANYNLSIGPKLNRKSKTNRASGSIKLERTWSWGVPKTQREYEPDLW